MASGCLLLTTIANVVPGFNVVCIYREVILIKRTFVAIFVIAFADHALAD
jgi:hypothetical protein